MEATSPSPAAATPGRDIDDPEVRYRTLVEQIPAITYVTSAEDDPSPRGRTLFISPQVEELLGYAPDEWLADSTLARRLLHPDDRPRVEAEERRAQAEGVPLDCRYRMRARDGRVVWFHDRLDPIVGPDGTVLGMQGVMLDITAQRRAEDDLRRREAILEAVAFAAQRLLRTADWREAIREVIRRLGKAAGVDRVALLRVRVDGSRALLSIPAEWHTEGLESLESMDDAAVPREYAEKGPFRRWIETLRACEPIVGNVADFPGSERPVLEALGTRSLVAVPLFAGEGWEGAIAFHSLEERSWSRDEIDALRTAADALGASIQQQLAAEALRRSEERFRWLTERAHDIVYRYRVAEPRGYDYVNPSVTRLVGYTPQEHYADPDLGLKIVHPDDRHLLERDRWPGLEAPVVLRWIRKDGSVVWMEQRQVPVLDPSGALMAVEGVDRDVTDRVVTERALQERMKELQCLYEVTRLANAGSSLDDLARATAEALARAMQYPDLAVAQVRLGEGAFTAGPPLGTGSGEEISAEIALQGGTRGRISVRYAEPREFLPEEEDLLRSLAGILASRIRRSDADRALRDSEARFRLLADNAKDFIYRYRLHPTPGFDYVSPSSEATSGYAPEDFYSDPDIWRKMVHPEDLETYDALLTDPVAAFQPFTLRWRRKDGSDYWSETRNTPVYDDGTLVAVEGIARDVTERVVAEEELRARVRQQTAVEEIGGLALEDVPAERLMSETSRVVAETLDVSLVGILEVDDEAGGLVLRQGVGWPDGAPGTVLATPDDGSPLGVAVGEGRPVAVADLAADEPRPATEIFARAGVRSYASVAVEGSNGHAFGALVVGSPSAGPFTDRDLSFLGSVAHVLTNAVRRRRAEVALEEREAQFRTLAENVPDVIARLDTELRVVYVNPAIEELTGLPGSAFIGKTFDDFESSPDLPPDEAGTMHRSLRKQAEVFRDVLERGENTTFEFEFPSPKGTRTLEASAIVEREASGKIGSLLVVSRDVTDRLRTKRKLEETVRLLRRTDEERGRLLARIVRAQEEERLRIAGDIHDDSIQVMSAAELRLGILRRGVGDGRQLELLDKVEGSVKRAISRLRHLMFELRPPSLDRDGLAAGIHTYIQQLREQDGPRYLLEAGLTREPELDLRALLFRIVQEAVTNARKHAGASTIRVTLAESEGGFLVRVRDDGAGFSPAKHRRREPGHLGLASMRERAEMADGTFRIDSAPGRGTTVEVWVPGTPPERSAVA